MDLVNWSGKGQFLIGVGWLALLLCIQEAPISYLGPEVGYLDRFSVFFSVIQGKCLDSTVRPQSPFGVLKHCGAQTN
jgi:hypothetical protein